VTTRVQALPGLRGQESRCRGLMAVEADEEEKPSQVKPRKCYDAALPCTTTTMTTRMERESELRTACQSQRLRR
jgi:hypothetical protein